MKPKSKLLSLLLAICLVVGLMPTAAFAAGTDTGKAIQLVDSGTAANIGGGQADNIYFGTYQQSSDGSGGYNTDPIKWRVLENADGQLFLLSDQNLDVFQYHTDNESVTWETSTMRSWLNGYDASHNTGGDSGIDYTSDNFIGTAFSAKEQAAIADTEVFNDDNPTYGTEGGNNTTDQIFLLSIAEAQNSSYFADNSSRIATNTAYVAGDGKLGSSYMNGVGEADYWWLRSPGDLDHRAAGVSVDGGVGRYGHSVRIAYNAVRPAFNLDLTSVLFTSAAVGGKIPAASSGGNQGGEAADAIFEIGDYDGSEWKLTLLDSGVVTFICGMARGIDLWAGEAVLQRKKSYPEIRLICATPYLGFERRWSESWQTLYARVAAQADYKVAISKQYDPGCFQRRNEWMVNHSGLVIAAYNGASGGTRNTILYAKKCGIPVYNILESTTDCG